jgi:hypothetical protein
VDRRAEARGAIRWKIADIDARSAQSGASGLSLRAVEQAAPPFPAVSSPAGRCCVCELPDGIGDSSPRCGAVVIIGARFKKTQPIDAQLSPSPIVPMKHIMINSARDLAVTGLLVAALGRGIGVVAQDAEADASVKRTARGFPA